MLVVFLWGQMTLIGDLASEVRLITCWMRGGLSSVVAGIIARMGVGIGMRRQIARMIITGRIVGRIIRGIGRSRSGRPIGRGQIGGIIGRATRATGTLVPVRWLATGLRCSWFGLTDLLLLFPVVLVKRDDSGLKIGNLQNSLHSGEVVLETIDESIIEMLVKSGLVPLGLGAESIKLDDVIGNALAQGHLEALKVSLRFGLGIGEARMFLQLIGEVLPASEMGQRRVFLKIGMEKIMGSARKVLKGKIDLGSVCGIGCGACAKG
jgi:hypothetical protein